MVAKISSVFCSPTRSLSPIFIFPTDKKELNWATRGDHSPHQNRCRHKFVISQREGLELFLCWYPKQNKKIKIKNKKAGEVEYDPQTGTKCKHFEKQKISPNIRSC